MVPRNFPYGVMPSIASGRIAFGVVGDAMYVYDWAGPDPIYRDVYAPTRGDPDLSPDGQLVGYFDARDQGHVRGLEKQRTIALLGTVRGLHAIRMRDDAVVYTRQHEAVVERRLSNGVERILGPYSPTGIAYLTPGSYVSSEANLAPPLLNPSRAGVFAAGSIAPDALGVVLDGSPLLTVGRGINWQDCRVLETGPGEWALATWSDVLHVCRLVTGIRTLADIAAAFPETSTKPAPTPDPEPQPEPDPMPTPYIPIQSHLDVVDAIWRLATPGQRAAHGLVANAVAWELDRVRADGRRWYRNLKRGGPYISEDAISTPHPQGAGGWAIIDVVSAFGRDDAAPAWIDVTQQTIDLGEIGGGLPPVDPGIETPAPPAPSPPAPVPSPAPCPLPHTQPEEYFPRYKEVLHQAMDSWRAIRDEMMPPDLLMHLAWRLQRDHRGPHNSAEAAALAETELRANGEWHENW
jgi:hypothetical protein